MHHTPDGTPFEQLVDQTHQRAGSADPTGLLDAAAAISAEHAADADRLLDHFVAHARSTGASWTDIGARLGVSKQAARQRFADTAPAGAVPYADRLHACLDQAREHARADGAAEAGTQHLLAGLLTEGVVAAIGEATAARPSVDWRSEPSESPSLGRDWLSATPRARLIHRRTASPVLT
jgi:hypothetical protein